MDGFFHRIIINGQMAGFRLADQGAYSGSKLPLIPVNVATL